VDPEEGWRLMARKTIRQRISLDGGEQIRRELQEFGEAGERAFKDLQAAAERVNLDKGLGASLARLQKQFATVGKDFKALGKQMRDVGKSFSTYVTLPIAGAGTGILKLAADFESAMNELQANTGAVGDSFDALEKKAIELGDASIFSARESAEGMNELAKVGLDVETIMGGAADAMTNLAAANKAAQASAAAVVGDVIAQFGLSTGQLTGIVNEITGATIESKLQFQDYALAIGQAGGTAGALGVEFDEFNATLAATASSFASGSDAGTSFKTFLQRLTPDTKKAKAIFEEFNLQFFDAEGNFLGLANAAEELRTKLGDLSDEQRNIVFGVLFGTDAIRTALKVMQLGGAGIEDMMRKLKATDAAAIAAVRVKGLAGELDQFNSAVEGLSIAIGKSGLLQFITDLVTQATEWLKALRETNPEVLKMGTIVAGLAAAFGPLLTAWGSRSSASAAWPAPSPASSGSSARWRPR